MLETEIQMLILVGAYMVMTDIVTGFMYTKKRQLRRKYLGKTALFHCFEVNPKVSMSYGRGEQMTIMPVWKVFRK
jgi:hypothetical protein